MKGAIFYATSYGSTADYANWISEATDLPAIDIGSGRADPEEYDFLVLGSAVLYFRPIIYKWVKRHMFQLAGKPLVFFTVSGAPAGPKLDGWLRDFLPDAFIARMDHVALQGRSDPAKLRLFDRLMLKVAAFVNRRRHPDVARDENEGFDHMDRSSIAPIVQKIDALKAR